MLVNFKFKNIYSFKELQEFSMVAGSTIRNSERLIKYKNSKILKFTSIFGANASGKSNFVKAITLMRNLIINGLPKYYLDCFYKLQDRTKVEPSYFETTLIIKNKLYSYGFEINFTNNYISSEWLYEIKNNKYLPIFERVDNGIKFSNKFNKQLIERLNVYAEDIYNSDVLLLHYLNTNKPSLYKYKEAIIFKEIYNWFNESLDINYNKQLLLFESFDKMNKTIIKLQEYLEYFDTGIKRVLLKDVSNNEAIKELPIQELNKCIFNIKDKNTYLYSINDNIWVINKSNNQIDSIKQLYFYHDLNCKYEFELSSESNGTKRLINLLLLLLNDDINKVYFIDELDKSLHPLLSKKFIELFLDKAKEENNSNQLIATLNESNILDFDLVRRDEIWFTEKKENVSSIYSLEEFNVRFDKKIDKAYLEGRFGGIPNIK